MDPGTAKKEVLIRSLREPLSIIFWVYAFLKLFVFDIDIYFAKLISPRWHLLIIEYKAVVLLLIAAIFLLITGSKLFFCTLSYVLSYPFIQIPWKLIKKLYGAGANAIFTFIAMVILTVKSGKEWFISFALFIAAVTVVFVDLGNIFTIIAMVVLFALLCKHLYRRFATAFRPENILSAINKFLRSEWASQREKTILQDFRDSEKYPPESDAYVKKKAETIKNLILYNNFFRLLAYKLKDFHESRILIVYSIFRLIYTFVLTVLIFSLEFFSLHRIMPGSFTSQSVSTFFTYIYLSFNAIRGSNVTDISPASTLAKVLTSLETIFGMSILIILFFFFTTVMRQKYEEELKELIGALEAESFFLNNILVADFSTTQEEIDQQYREFLLTFKINEK